VAYSSTETLLPLAAFANSLACLLASLRVSLNDKLKSFVSLNFSLNLFNASTSALIEVLVTVNISDNQIPLSFI